MVSKNNQWNKLQQGAQRVPHYGIRKLSVGVASVLLGTTLFMGGMASASTQKPVVSGNSASQTAQSQLGGDK